MGKTYIDTVKYLVKGNIEIDGIVEKPDIVGAIFGQTEGLLGEDLDLRELLKSGRIGRIEVDTKVASGKTSGKIAMPSSLDKAETAMIAAALETVDRVGPCEAHIIVKDIEDTRANKRNFLMDRAKQLLQDLDEDTKESKEFKTQLRADVRTAALKKYGRDKLDAGPDIDTSEEIIVVEGRADVINLLSYGIRNVIAMQGAIVPDTIAALSKKKTTVLFVDGDRGGDMAVTALADAGKVDFVCRAPDGKEVEELTQKEILASLKHRMSLDEYFEKSAAHPTVRSRMSRERSPRSGDRRDSRGPRDRDSRAPRSRGPRDRDSRGPRDRDSRGPRDRDSRGPRDRDSRAPRSRGPRDRDSRGPPRDRDSRSRGPPRDRRDDRYERRPAREPVPEDLSKVYDGIKDSMKAVLLDSSGKAKKKVAVAEMINAMKETKCDSVVFDGIVTQRLVNLADSQGVTTLVGLKEGKLENRKRVKVFTMA